MTLEQREIDRRLSNFSLALWAAADTISLVGLFIFSANNSWLFIPTLFSLIVCQWVLATTRFLIYKPEGETQEREGERE